MIKTILVTGSSQGLGRAIALKLVENNCRVYAVGRNKKRLEELAAHSNLITPISADLGTEHGRTDILKAVKNCGDLSIIHNAAIAKPSLFDAMTEDLLREHFEINYLAPVLLTQQLLPLLTRGQRVLHISSGAADMALPGLMPYCVSKSALEHSTACLNIELNSSGIYFANLRPGMIDTPMQANLRHSSVESLPDREFYLQAAKENKLSTPESAAAFVAAVFLHTKDSDFSKNLWNISNPAHHAIASR